MGETQSEKAADVPTNDLALKKSFWPRELVLGLLPLLIGFELLVWTAYLPLGLRGIADFRTLYASGYMARMHDARDIYNSDKLAKVKEDLAPIGRTFNQPMDHPAYEVLLYAPLSFFSYRHALMAFIVFNLGIVFLCVRLLRPSFHVLSDRWKPFPGLIFLCFFPITRAITQGQDSILLLALLAGALVCLQKEKDWLAGLLTGFGLLKFQVVIPIAVLFLLWKRWRFVSGFATSSVATALISMALVGIEGTRQYANMLFGMSLNLRSEADAMRYSLSPRTMLNLRGLLSAVLVSRIPHWWLQALIILGSLTVLWLAARRRASLPLAIITDALVSYHLNAQDACVMIIPIGIFLGMDSVWLVLLALLALIAPVTAISPLYGFIGAIPIVALFIAYLVEHRRFESVESSVVPA